MRASAQPHLSVQTRQARQRQNVQHGCVSISGACHSTAEALDPDEAEEESNSDGSGNWEPSPTADVVKDSRARGQISAAKKQKVSECDHAAPSADNGKGRNKIPKGCGACPICNRTFSIALLQRHVEACLVSVDVTNAAQRPARGPLEGSALNSKSILDLTDSPSAALTGYLRNAGYSFDISLLHCFPLKYGR